MKGARVHEKTVQAVAKGEVGPVAKKARKPRQNRTQPLQHLVVNAMVMEAAKEITAGGRYTRIEILDANTVIVR